MMTWIVAASCLLAFMPALLFLRNLSRYRPLPSRSASRPACSVLIPARNEAANIADAVKSVLSSEGIELEVIVLDDQSDDATAEIVQKLAAMDSRLRLEKAPRLPVGWVGKNFACHQLTGFARHPLLVFMDADVRVTRPDSLARLAQFADKNGAALVSGVPREETVGLLEKMIVPLIHFVLLGYLPLGRMRSTTDPRFAAACGQILAVQRVAYEQTGGHAAIAGRIHDAVALARHFRTAGLTTDLFDGTDTFHCRMYRRPSDVWQGFVKNAHEGLGSPPLIVPATFLLLGGQLLPLILFALTPSLLTLSASIAVYLPRLIAVRRFRQSLLGAILHPLGICLLVAIQWDACFRSLCKRPAVWKGRSYSPASTA